MTTAHECRILHTTRTVRVTPTVEYLTFVDGSTPTLHAEIASLHRELGQEKARVEKAEAEVERLRGALQSIADSTAVLNHLDREHVEMVAAALAPAPAELRTKTSKWSEEHLRYMAAEEDKQDITISHPPADQRREACEVELKPGWLQRQFAQLHAEEKRQEAMEAVCKAALKWNGKWSDITDHIIVEETLKTAIKNLAALEKEARNANR